MEPAPGHDRPSARTRARRISVLGAVFVILSSAVALAWTIGTTNPGNALTAATLAAPTGVSGSKGAGAATNCTSVTVSWTAAAAPVNTYIVESKTANGAWTVVNADTGNVTSIADTTTYTQRKVSYRVAAGYKGGTLSNWTSATASAPTPVTCGNVGEVTDLAVARACASAVLTWTAPTGATHYDVQASTDGGSSWTTLATDITALTYSDVTARTSAATVLYQVRPAAGAGAPNDGQWGNTATLTGWGFYVTDIEIVGDADNQMEAGEKVAVTFSVASNGTTPSGVGANSVFLSRANPRGFYLASASGTLTGSGIGQIVTSGSFVSNANDGAYTGTEGWTAANTVWTWTKGAGTVPFTGAPVITGFSVGASTTPIRVKCSDGATILIASTPTITGSF